MPLKRDDVPPFDLAGVRVRGLSSPSRGALETTSYLVELGPGQRFPSTRMTTRSFHVMSGSLTVTLDGKETILAAGDTVMVPPGVSHFPSATPEHRAELLAMIPVGTIMIRPDGERVSPPWGV